MESWLWWNGTMLLAVLKINSLTITWSHDWKINLDKTLNFHQIYHYISIIYIVWIIINYIVSQCYPRWMKRCYNCFLNVIINQNCTHHTFTDIQMHWMFVFLHNWNNSYLNVTSRPGKRGGSWERHFKIEIDSGWIAWEFSEKFTHFCRISVSFGMIKHF